MKKKVQALILTAHPNPRSLSSAAADRAQAALHSAGLFCVRRDLYQNGEPLALHALDQAEYHRKASFLPLVQEFEALVAGSDVLVFCYPDWWGQMPGILKNWFDRVFRTSTAYTMHEDTAGIAVHVPLLSGKLACVYVTADETANSPQERIWTDSICRYTGLELAGFEILTGVRGSTAKQRRAWLSSVERSAAEVAIEINLDPELRENR